MKALHPFAAIAFAALTAGSALAADKTPKQVLDDCLKAADIEKEDDLKHCVGKTGQLLLNCQKRASNKRITADTACPLAMQQAINSAGQKARDAAAREALRKK